MGIFENADKRKERVLKRDEEIKEKAFQLITPYLLEGEEILHWLISSENHLIIATNERLILIEPNDQYIIPYDEIIFINIYREYSVKIHTQIKDFFIYPSEGHKALWPEPLNKLIKIWLEKRK
jgi:hypothetical protein